MERRDLHVGQPGTGHARRLGPAPLSRANLGTQAVFAVPAGPSARAVLVWITNLPPSGRLDISEIHLR